MTIRGTWLQSRRVDDFPAVKNVLFGGISLDSFPGEQDKKNKGTPKSSILIGFSIINHPFWGTPIFGNTHIENI